jgi:hypothetical protein
MFGAYTLRLTLCPSWLTHPKIFVDFLVYSAFHMLVAWGGNSELVPRGPETRNPFSFLDCFLSVFQIVWFILFQLQVYYFFPFPPHSSVESIHWVKKLVNALFISKISIWLSFVSPLCSTLILFPFSSCSCTIAH